MATVSDKRKEWALQGIASSPSTQVARPPLWHEYLSGITKGLEARGPATSPFPAGFPTQRRREFQEQTRQYEEQMALQRAEAARRAEEARTEMQKLTKQDIVSSIMALVDDAFMRSQQVQGITPEKIWGSVEEEMLRAYGRFPEDLDYQTAMNIAWDYFQRHIPGYEEELPMSGRRTWPESMDW